MDLTLRKNNHEKVHVDRVSLTAFWLTPFLVTFARPRNESKEEKQARKHAAKAERQTRRAAKKERTNQFDAEFKQQKRALGAAEPKGRKL